jgi:hypothetical protein
MAERVKSLQASAGSGTKPLPPRLDWAAPDSTKLSTQGTRPAVAMLMLSNSKRGRLAARSCSAHRNANFAQQLRLAPWPSTRSWMENLNRILTITMNQI